MNQTIEISVPENCTGERVDRFLTEYSELELSRSFVQKLIKKGNVSVSDVAVKPNFKVREGDLVRFTIPEPEKSELLAQDIPLDIVYEDDDLAVINKQAGLVVHPGPGNPDSTLVNALLFHMKGLSSIGGVERPGIVHRLDRDTSGLMVVAKNDKTHAHLTSQFQNGDIIKFYRAVTSSKPLSSHFVVEKPIGRHPKYRQKMAIVEGGRMAKSEFFLEKVWDTSMGTFSLFNIRIYTGRTHQIRVHASSMRLPIVGDPVYSKKSNKYKVPWLLLASVRLSFVHPAKEERMNFEIDIPQHMIEYISKLDGELL